MNYISLYEENVSALKAFKEGTGLDEAIKHIKTHPTNAHKYLHILALIPQGERNAVHLSELSKTVSSAPALVKEAIMLARIEGWLVVSNSDGYFFAENTEELRKYYRSTERRITGSQLALRAFRLFFICERKEGKA